MLRATIPLAIGLFAISSPANAQLRRANLQPVTSDVKDAGTYNVATGTWTRGASAATLAGPGVLYDNTCMVGYHVTLQEGDVITTSGRIPSTSSPSNGSSLTGWADNYSITEF